MRNITIVDSYYPEFLKSWHLNPAMSYESNLRQLLDFSFGTADFYSRGLRELGWRATDIVSNYRSLNALQPYSGLVDQVASSNPDILFLQDLSTFTAFELSHFKRRGYVIAGQCSCELPGDAILKYFDFIFTSFPHYLPKFAGLGINGVFLPLAFDPVVLGRVGELPERDIAASFVGGIGWQWTNSRIVLDAAAIYVPGMRFYGYGYEQAPNLPWQGYAWGLDYYRILLRSKIVLNRHGAVSRGYSNNLRLFEATGCGALVVTEDSPNVHDYFAEDEIVTYRSAADACDKINYYVKHEDERAAIAMKGQARTLKDHHYSKRLTIVSDVLHARLGAEVMHHPV